MKRASAESYTLLIIDDDDVFRDHLAQHLRHDGEVEWAVAFEVAQAREAVECERLIRDGGLDPDAVILDVDFTQAGGGPEEGIDYLLPRFSVLRAECGRPAQDALIYVVSGQDRPREWERDNAQRVPRWGAVEFRCKRDGVLTGSFLDDIVRELRARRDRETRS